MIKQFIIKYFRGRDNNISVTLTTNKNKSYFQIMASYDPNTKIWSNPESTPLYNLNANLGQVIIHSLSMYPNKIVQISADTDIKLTGREIRIRTIRIAENLRERGYKSGDILAICARNSENVAPVFYAALLLGTPINTLDPDFQIGE